MTFPRGLKQTATHWSPGVPDGYGGSTYGAPVSMVCKWEERAVLFRDDKGDETISKAVVFLPSDVGIGDYLFLGESVVADPTTIDAHEVRQFSSIPDLRNAKQERKAYL